MNDTAHAGASTEDRALSSWLPWLASADAELIPELGALVARSRDLIRNHPVAAGAAQTLTDNVVGTGLRLNAQPNYRVLGMTSTAAQAWAAETEALWRDYGDSTAADAADQLDFKGLCALVFRTTMISGEALALPLWLPDRGDGFATKIMLVDPDRLSNPRGMPDREQTRGGIETDLYGQPIAYHVRKSHPGDVIFAAEAEWERIPARTEFGRRRAIHVHDKERTGQSRGKPILTPALATFRMLDHYERSELQAAIVNAMIAAFIETPLDQESLVELFGGEGGDYLAKKKEWQVKLQGGSVIPIFPGDKMTPFTPARPNAAYKDFTTNILQHIGTSLGLPLELLMKDFSRTNYSSARAALLEAWRFFMGRRQWLGTYFATPVYQLWLEEMVSSGRIKAPNFYQNRTAWGRCAWIGPGRGWIDPLKEAQAAQARIDGNISTLERECAEQGLDWEEVLEQRQRELAKLRALGLDKPAPQPTPPAKDDPEEPDEPEPGQDEPEEATRPAAAHIGPGSYLANLGQLPGFGDDA